MNIEKTECDRLGYEYKSLLEQVVYALHHIPYAKDFINEEGLKKLDDLSLKLSTGNCEIIEFKRTLCKYNFTDILKEKDKEIDRLNNIINHIDSFVDRTIEVIKQQPTGDDEWILERLNGIKYLIILKEYEK